MALNYIAYMCYFVLFTIMLGLEAFLDLQPYIPLVMNHDWLRPRIGRWIDFFIKSVLDYAGLVALVFCVDVE
jgi:hypothetical protein